MRIPTDAFRLPGEEETGRRLRRRILVVVMTLVTGALVKIENGGVANGGECSFAQHPLVAGIGSEMGDGNEVETRRWGERMGWV